MTEPLGFDAFYAASSRRLVHAVYAMTGDLAEAQDCVQEAYERAWLRWRTVASYDDPEAWVRTVAMRRAISRWRKTRNSIAALVKHSEDKVVTAPSEDNVALVAALRQIPDAQRRAVVLHHLCGMSVADVARETEAPVGTVKARLSRGRAALALLLDDEPLDACNDDADPEVSRA